MPVRVFISHSVAPWELALVNSVADVTAQRGATPTIPDRAWKPSVDSLPSRIAAQIQASDYLIAIATQWGQHLDWLNQEVMYNQQLSKPSLIVADAGIPLAPEYDCIRIDRANPLATLIHVSNRIQGLIQDHQTQALMRGLLITGLALLFLKGK